MRINMPAPLRNWNLKSSLSIGPLFVFAAIVTEIQMLQSLSIRAVGLVLGLAVSSALAACQPFQDDLVSKRSFQLQCQAGCQDPDPDPDAPGYYFAGENSQWEGCTADGVPDEDGDGLSDMCEANLAAAFAPEMSLLDLDDTRRETRWAARPDYDQGVVIFYAIGYWYDNGDTGSSFSLCIGWPFDHNDCHGHPGDSESIALRVRFNSDTRHWYLYGADYSQHTGTGYYVQNGGESSTPVNPATGHALVFPDRDLGYPMAWASDGKHANYADADECDDGGTAGADQCDVLFRSSVRLDARAERNLGSYSIHTIDCVPTDSVSHPAYAAHITECYWSWKRFGGWWVDQTDPEIAVYFDRLFGEGFIPF